jgi:hypothetical protein
MASAPDFVEVGAVLDGTTEMGTNGGNSAVVTIDKNEQGWPIAKTKYLGAVGFEVLDFASYNFILAQIRNDRRDEIAQYWVDKRNDGGKQTPAEKNLDELATRWPYRLRILHRHDQRKLCFRMPASCGGSVLFCQIADKPNHFGDLVLAQLPVIGGHVILALGDDLSQFRVGGFLDGIRMEVGNFEFFPHYGFAGSIWSVAHGALRFKQRFAGFVSMERKGQNSEGCQGHKRRYGSYPCVYSVHYASQEIPASMRKNAAGR